MQVMFVHTEVTFWVSPGH